VDEGRYRVVLTGDLVSGFRREAVIAALARLFETSAGRLVGIFDGADYPIDEELSASDAAALQQRLKTLGAHARIERVSERPAAHSSLHLPQNIDSAAAGLMRCPACGHQQLVTKRCDECGVIFAEYNRRVAGRSMPPPAPGADRPTGSPSLSPQLPPVTQQSIHSRQHNGWHDAWVDEGEELPTEQYHVNLYMGPAGAGLAATCQRMTLGRRTQLRLSWSGGAVISPFLWALYRKMWGLGSLIFIAEVLLPVLLIAVGSKPSVSDKLTYLGIAGIFANRLFWPAILKFLYCRHARNAVAYMNRMSPTYASDIDIATAGGTSKTSAFVGLVLAIVLSLLAWNAVDTLYASMMKSATVFDDPPAVENWTQLQERNADDMPPEADRLSEQNKWVATRNRLRVLGQRIGNWLGKADSDVDPARLNMDAIARALSLDEDSRMDGWGSPIRYRYQRSGGFVLRSAGPDGEFDTGDDVVFRRSLDR
jgi:hypothetical protein